MLGFSNIKEVNCMSRDHGSQQQEFASDDLRDLVAPTRELQPQTNTGIAFLSEQAVAKELGEGLPIAAGVNRWRQGL
jgi:hypothetical protein